MSSSTTTSSYVQTIPEYRPISHSKISESFNRRLDDALIYTTAMNSTVWGANMVINQLPQTPLVTIPGAVALLGALYGLHNYILKPTIKRRENESRNRQQSTYKLRANRNHALKKW